MDKNAIKKFAVWARTELIARVSLKVWNTASQRTTLRTPMRTALAEKSSLWMKRNSVRL